MARTNIQKLVNKLDRIYCDKDGDMIEFAETCEDLGKRVYREALKGKECTIMIKNPRK